MGAGYWCPSDGDKEPYVYCDSPQYLLSGGITACGLCLKCCRLKSDAERQRKLYWLKRKRGFPHVSAS